ncbi:V-type ATP synthase subunit I [Anaerocolumna cellulosilytica]|uniref:V-type ATP synthase subunit I n=1 Tax=Anaerocolumna cellulosilytica TaxID=433286 RepID=A0A6S6R6E6_9FIRM|nr:V-type ATPase 116kDa subunit family protein [Anaerocolumna cellulosilytica]MBB5195918.1 V/A-type H+-transporting ATPase subunit I [Anaerocolumna cellulosilytica]BCJ96929.1 V-type ATP synthase subunit I [Anaerocolumna cellulosilytica]
MIEKMKFLSITGPRSEFDRVVNVYLSKYEVHLENALSELKSVHDLKPFVEINPYKDVFSKSQELVDRFDKETPAVDKDMTPSMASAVINSASHELEDLTDKKKSLKVERDHLTELIKKIEPFRHLDYAVDKILDFKFIKFRFGRISHEYYNKFSKFVYDSLTTLFFECDSDSEYVWGVYFVPGSQHEKIDAIYSSLHFERIFIPAEYEGTPEEAYRLISRKKDAVVEKIKEIDDQIKERLNSKAVDILAAHEVLKAFNSNFDVRKLAACTRDSNSDSFYFILCGWITEKNVASLVKDIDNDANIYCMLEDDYEGITAKPPTKLKNFKLFKPFEMFISMYGLPAYNEIDPTSFVAITYSLIFGIMFGDVGQGLCLVLGGALLYKIKKVPLAAIVSIAGIFSTIMGFMYGSFFGFEHAIPTGWLKPMENVMTVLMVAVAFGSILIIIAMVINIINGIKAKDVEKIFFDTNGVAGLVFYVMALVCVLLIFTGHALPATILLAVFFGIPLLLMFFKEPLTHYVEKKSKIFPDQKGMFFVESFFELFEVVLSYLTNSISFLRVGAFALSHAAMMGVVMLLANVESGNPNIFILILGNLFVAGMEGLIVGIQVLRLEYYEMFSRFYRGTGKGFRPYKSK